MATILFTHESCVDHDPGPMHPESPARLRAVHAALANDKYANLERREARLRRSSKSRAFIRPLMSKRSSKPYRAKAGSCWMAIRMSRPAPARRPAGRSARRAAVDAVVGKETDNAFCAVRPPGHHAEQSIPMGFCVFNSVAAGAEHARQQHGMERAAVVDFDVHHGNGTQAMFWADAGLFLRQLIRCRFTPVRKRKRNG